MATRRSKAPAKQIATEMLPSRQSLSKVTGGDMFSRSINYYAKQSPANVSGEKQEKLTRLLRGGV
jgi:hypothetical protein